jgi:BirA family transcriptional regulator, biotin operon repressor / biotin---[acetyl-CoA-carboxylase] ligase
MRLLTDTPHTARSLLAEGHAWRPGAGDAEGADLWATFGAGTEPWSGPGRPAGGDGGWCLVLDEAPRSQFDLIGERLAVGAQLPDGLACVALAGSRFHGQRGRAWAALRGNLHLSVHFAVDLDAAACQVGLTLLPAVATARAIEAVTDGRLRPGLKWVNDLLCDDRKVAGVLSSTQLQGERVRHVVCGIGVNVAQAPALPPSPRAAPPGHLAPLDPAFAGPDAWAVLLVALLRELERGRRALAAGEGATLFAAYRERAAFLGRRVAIWPVDEGPDPAATRPLAVGRVLDLNPDLSLVLEGVTAPIHAGRMTLDG